MKRAFVIVGALLWAGNAFADFDRWTVKETPDPFTGGAKVEVDYLTSIRSGSFLICDTSKRDLELRVIAGWQYVDDLEGALPTGKVAVDGKVLFEVVGAAGAYGSNVAGVSFKLSRPKAEALAMAMEDAQKQVAVQDGISDGPMLMGARGSTVAGKALRECLVRQGGDDLPIVTDKDEGQRTAAEEAERPPVSGLVRQAMFIIYSSLVEERCKAYQLKPAVKGYGRATDFEKRSIDELISQERPRTVEDLRGQSCAAIAHSAMEWTDLAYDQVWVAP